MNSATETFAERRSEHKADYRILRPGGEVRWIDSARLCFLRQRWTPTTHGWRQYRCHRTQAVGRAPETCWSRNSTIGSRTCSLLLPRLPSTTSEHSGSLIDFDRRIQSMADAHALLSRSQSQSASLADLVRHELAPYDSGENTSAVGPYVGLTAAATQTMAMVLHELATNAAKYGALSTPLGWVSVRWDLQSNGSGPAQLRLQWHENGGPLVTTPGRPGYGTSVIRELVPYELGGTVEIEYKEKGVSCTIEFAIQSDGDRAAFYGVA